jgi:para-nitrobenzyl esterase
MGLGSVIILPAFNLPYSGSQTSYVIAKTEKGKIRGIRESGVNIFKGIPYAGRV